MQPLKEGSLICFIRKQKSPTCVTVLFHLLVKKKLLGRTIDAESEVRLIKKIRTGERVNN